MNRKLLGLCIMLSTSLLARDDQSTISTLSRPPWNSEPKPVAVELPPWWSKGKSVVEVKAGYFTFANAQMRNVFDRGGLDLQLSGSSRVWHWLQLYGSVEYLQRSGRSIYANQKTQIWEIPLSVGLKPVIPICDFMQYYFAFGPRYVFCQTSNHSAFVDRHLNSNGFGFFANTGFDFFPIPALAIDVFAEYSYAKFSFHPTGQNVYGATIQVGGYSFGAGLGYAF